MTSMHATVLVISYVGISWLFCRRIIWDSRRNNLTLSWRREGEGGRVKDQRNRRCWEKTDVLGIVAFPPSGQDIVKVVLT